MAYNQGSNQVKQSNSKLIAGQPSGHHRRSKTDGNVGSLMFKNDKNKATEHENMRVMKDQLQKHEVMQFAQSRQ